MILFHLLRKTDATGVSGTGLVAEGVRFSDGTCCVRWRTVYASTCTYASIEDVHHIHGHGGATVIDFLGDWHMTPFGRGVAEYAQDACENIPQEAGKTGEIIVPAYVSEANRAEWENGYRFCMVRDFGAGWPAVMRNAAAAVELRRKEWEEKNTAPKKEH